MGVWKTDSRRSKKENAGVESLEDVGDNGRWVQRMARFLGHLEDLGFTVSQMESHCRAVCWAVAHITLAIVLGKDAKDTAVEAVDVCMNLELRRTVERADINFGVIRI